jgi:Ser/Thr protein kinase RdoA (MazF antagonist)
MSDQTFIGLSRQAQLRHLRGVAQKAISAYGIEPRTIRMLRYEDNAVYRVETAGEAYMLRLSLRDGRSVVEQQSELYWLRQLTEAGKVAVPLPVLTTAGESVGEISSPLLTKPSTFVLFQWIPGKDNPSYDDSGVAEGLGEVTAQLHAHATITDCPAWFTRPSWDVGDLFDSGPAMNEERARAMLGMDGLEAVRVVGSRIRHTLSSKERDWGLIHADLHRENLVVTDSNTIAVIDFDDCGYGYYMLDIATVLSSVYRRVLDDPAAYRAFAVRYLNGYQKVRSLPSEFDRLEDFLIMRDMVIVNFVTHSTNPTVAEWGPARVRGILDQLKRYIDGEPYGGVL